MQLNIRPFRPTDSYTELTALLHLAYAPLWKAGMKFWAAYQTEEITKQRAERGHCFVIEENNALVATITTFVAGPHSKCEYYRRPGVRVFGQFAVDPSLQHRGIGAAMLAHVEQFAIANGALELACDTAETAEGLVEYYARLGFKHVAYQQWDETNYRSKILSKLLGEM